MSEKPVFKVVKGKPTDYEIEALTELFGKLIAASKPAIDPERNQWSKPRNRLQPEPVFNPSAFRPVAYF